MKKIKVITLFIFSIIILLPLCKFNFKENSSSSIDNRMLANNPFTKDFLQHPRGLISNIENYLNDRIGFRDQMIKTYTIMNDKLFAKMVHPSYTYGKDGYIFGAGLTTIDNQYSDFHDSFVNMVEKIQQYCSERNIPFLFVFNPAKPAIYSEYIADGVNYSRAWVDQLFAKLQEKKVNYLDNTLVFKEKKEAGEIIFNKMYDANHWNDLGAYYGTNAIISKLQQYFPNLQQNNLDDLVLSEDRMTSLPVSEFPIDELVPRINIPFDKIENLTDAYKEHLNLDEKYDAFLYLRNENKLYQSKVNALVFQGSYMNHFGYKYLANVFSNYIAIHDYQNIQDFDYYYNIFKPDCVIFELAEYTVKDGYFTQEKMADFKLNPNLNSFKEKFESSEMTLDKSKIIVEDKKKYKTIIWQIKDDYEYVWLELNSSIYDMKKTDRGYETTILSSNYSNGNSISIDAFNEEKIYHFE